MYSDLSPEMKVLLNVYDPDKYPLEDMSEEEKTGYMISLFKTGDIDCKFEETKGKHPKPYNCAVSYIGSYKIEKFLKENE